MVWILDFSQKAKEGEGGQTSACMLKLEKIMQKIWQKMTATIQWSLKYLLVIKESKDYFQWNAIVKLRLLGIEDSAPSDGPYQCLYLELGKNGKQV